MVDPAENGAAHGRNDGPDGSKKFDHRVLTVIETALKWAAHSDGLKSVRGGRRDEALRPKSGDL